MRKVKTYKISIYFSILLFVIFVNVSCGKLSQKTAQETFLKENPTYIILSSETGEGWDGVEYHQFAFKKPNDEKVYKEIWCFEQQHDSTWKVTGRSTPKE